MALYWTIKDNNKNPFGYDMTTAYITHTYCDRHNMGDDHPESPQRLGAIQNRLITGQLMDFLRRLEATPATREQLVATHDQAYVDSIFA
ncbi:MAG: acetoin utilization deacetylase AcuC-like enzyme, partial [Marinomonas primoryensis]